MKVSQEPKYDLVLHDLFARWQNRATGKFVSLDEPTFVLRGNCTLTLPVLHFYENLMPPSNDHRRAVRGRISDFQAYRAANADRVCDDLVPDYAVRYIEGRPVMASETGVITDDEPVFVFRAQDALAIDVLCYYIELAKTDRQVRWGSAMIKAFDRFRSIHPELMKTPDTASGSISPRASGLGSTLVDLVLHATEQLREYVVNEYELEDVLKSGPDGAFEDWAEMDQQDREVCLAAFHYLRGMADSHGDRPEDLYRHARRVRAMQNNDANEPSL